MSSASAAIFTSAPSSTLLEFRTCARAAVRFVVVPMFCWPRTFLIWLGDSPKSKPGGGTPCLSPASNRSGLLFFHSRAASTVFTGKKQATPWASPVIILEVARRTSNTTTVVSRKSVSFKRLISAGESATSIIWFSDRSSANDEKGTAARNQHTDRNSYRIPTSGTLQQVDLQKSTFVVMPGQSKHRLVLRPSFRRQTARRN